jgi:hypothetical protein
LAAPSALHAKDSKIDWPCVRGDNTVGPNHAILLASGHDFTRKQKQCVAGIVVKHQPIDLGALPSWRYLLAWPNQAWLGSGFRHGDLPGANPFVKSHQQRCIVRLIGYHREDGQVLMHNRWQNLEGALVIWSARKSRTGQR